MDFFGHQEAARRATSRLVLYFVLAVLSIIAALYGLAVLVFLYLDTEQNPQPDLVEAFWNPTLLGYVAAATLAIVTIGSLFKTAQLRRGGPAVAEALGATPVNSDTLDRDERRLINVVEEMAIASGAPMPAVYIMRDEPGINAFAAGFSINDAVVAVTRGTLIRLTRDELQGVIAHEFSHIFNGDMRLNIRLMGVLHGILLIALLGQLFLRGGILGRSSSRSDGKGRAVVMMVALALLVIGYLGVFFGRLIKAAVSREREFLADAAAVQFTRNPDGIGGALKKIGGFADGSTLQAPNAEIASHSYFGPGLRALSAHALATHPPLEDRIRRIDPQWQGGYTAESAQTHHTETASALAGASSGLSATIVSDPQAAFALAPDDAVSRAGAPAPAHMEYAHNLLLQLPDEILGAAHDPYGARALAYSMVIDQDQTVWRKQLDLLHLHADPGVLRMMEKLHKTVAELPRQSYLPLMTLCTAALRGLSPRQYQDFRQTLETLIDADGIHTPFEFALLRVLRRHLDRHFAGTKRAGTIHRSLDRRARECGVLLSALAQIGHDDPAAAETAFQAGLSRLDLKTPPALIPADQTDLVAMGAALDRLEQVTPLDKKKLIAACAASIASDGQVTVEEGEILRAVSDSLEVPMPPFLAEGTPVAAT